MAETQGLRNKFEDVTDYLKKFTRNVHSVFSDQGARTTVSSTRHDTAGRGINSIYFMTSGALTSLTDTKNWIALSTLIDSGTTMQHNTLFVVTDCSKVKCSSHGAQVIYLNS